MAEGAVLHGEAGRVVHGDADGDVQLAGEVPKEVMVAHAGERAFSGREPDIRRGQLDAPDRDRGRIPDGDEPQHEFIPGPARGPQGHVFPAGLQRDAIEFRPEDERCLERVGARLQADGDGSLARVAGEEGLQRGPVVDILRSDVHRAAAALPGGQLDKAGERRDTARYFRLLFVPGQHGQRAGPGPWAVGRLGFVEVARRVDDRRLDRPQRKAPEVADVEAAVVRGKRDGDACVAERDRFARLRMCGRLPHAQVELRGLFGGKVVTWVTARRLARLGWPTRDYEALVGRLVCAGDCRDEARRRRDVVGLGEPDRIPQQLHRLARRRVVVAVHGRAGQRQSGAPGVRRCRLDPVEERGVVESPDDGRLARFVVDARDHHPDHLVLGAQVAAGRHGLANGSA